LGLPRFGLTADPPSTKRASVPALARLRSVPMKHSAGATALGGRGAALPLGRGSPASSRVLLGYGRDEGRARALPSKVVAEDY